MKKIKRINLLIWRLKAVSPAVNQFYSKYMSSFIN